VLKMTDGGLRGRHFVGCFAEQFPFLRPRDQVRDVLQVKCAGQIREMADQL